MRSILGQHLQNFPYKNLSMCQLLLTSNYLQLTSWKMEKAKWLPKYSGNKQNNYLFSLSSFLFVIYLSSLEFFNNIEFNLQLIEQFRIFSLHFLFCLDVFLVFSWCSLMSSSLDGCSLFSSNHVWCTGSTKKKRLQSLWNLHITFSCLSQTTHVDISNISKDIEIFL